MNLFYQATAISKNKKTGPIATSVTGNQSCPTTCEMKDACYASIGKGAIHWRKVSKGERGGDVAHLVGQIDCLPKKSYFRHNVAGDLPHCEGLIDLAEAGQIAKACKGRLLKAWTYTHHQKNPRNLAAARLLTKQGLTVNVSCHTGQEVDQVVAQGNLAVLVVSPDEKRVAWRTPAGNLVKVCPEQRGLGTCLQCQGLCSKDKVAKGGGETQDRHTVAFLGHAAPLKVKKILLELKVLEDLAPTPAPLVLDEAWDQDAYEAWVTSSSKGVN